MQLNDFIKFDKYFWIARFFPAAISLIPFFVFQYLYFDNLIFAQLKILENYSWVFHIVIVVLLMYVVSALIRGFGKDLVEYRYFIKNNRLPTTQILLGNKKVISEQQLTLLRLKIKRDFEIILIDRRKDCEMLLRINDAVDKIRVKVGYDNTILNQYNIEYGFLRNLTGGLLIFFIADVLLIWFSRIYNNQPVFTLSSIMFLAGVLFAIFSRHILENYGIKYAKQLFNEYLVKKDK